MDKRKKVKVIFIFLCLAVCLATALYYMQHNRTDKQKCTEINTEANVETEVAQEDDTKIENVDVEIPGIEREYNFIFASDLHIVTENDEITDENRETVIGREAFFKTDSGMKSADLWKNLVEYMNKKSPDGVLLGGDMIDFASTSNVKVLKEGIDQLKVPYMYVRADHDYGKWYGKLEKKYVKELHATINEVSPGYVMEYDDICVLGIDNSTSQLPAEALEKIKEVFAIGKPIILVTHVPIDSKLDSSLAEQSKVVWQDRALLWGDGCTYEPDENTREFLDMVYATDSPVKLVLSGHLHFSWDGYITENTREHVFNPAYSNSIGIVKIHG